MEHLGRRTWTRAAPLLAALALACGLMPPEEQGDGSPAPDTTRRDLPPAGFALVFEDEFEGASLDTSRWTAFDGERRDALSTEDAVEVRDASGQVIYNTTTVKSVGFGKHVDQIGREDLVTEHEIELPFDAGKEFKVSFWPTATYKSGYNSGREVTVRLAK